MSILKRITIIFCFLLSFTLLEAQFVITKQISDRMSGNLSKEKLDKGTHRCIYQFTQQITEIETGKTVFQTDTMALDFGKVFSVYYDWNKAHRDSILKEESAGRDVKVFHMKTDPDYDMVEYKDVQGNYSMISPKGESSKIYKNRLKKEIFSVSGASRSDPLKCVEQLNPQDWEFTSDTLTVLGYVCQKTTTSFRGRNYEAWFSPEIPIKEGPWKLYGLPGLILKVVVDDGLFVFEAIGLENLEDVYITMDKDSYVSSTREQFTKYKAKGKKRLSVHHFVNETLTIGSTKNPFKYNDLELE